MADGKKTYKPAKYLVAPPAALNKTDAKDVLALSVTVSQTAKFASDRKGIKFPTHRQLVNTGKIFADFGEKL